MERIVHVKFLLNKIQTLMITALLYFRKRTKQIKLTLPFIIEELVPAIGIGSFEAESEISKALTSLVTGTIFGEADSLKGGCKFELVSICSILLLLSLNTPSETM